MSAFIATGIEPLDRIMGGGLPMGLTVIGGIADMGVTSLVQQIGISVASQKIPVLYIGGERDRMRMLKQGIEHLFVPGGVPKDAGVASAMADALAHDAGREPVVIADPFFLLCDPEVRGHKTAQTLALRDLRRLSAHLQMPLILTVPFLGSELRCSDNLPARTSGRIAEAVWDQFRRFRGLANAASMLLALYSPEPGDKEDLDHLIRIRDPEHIAENDYTGIVFNRVTGQFRPTDSIRRLH